MTGTFYKRNDAADKRIAALGQRAVKAGNRTAAANLKSVAGDQRPMQ